MEVDDSQQKLDSWILFELASPKEIYHNTENATKPKQFRFDNLLYKNYLKFCQASSQGRFWFRINVRHRKYPVRKCTKESLKVAFPTRRW